MFPPQNPQGPPQGPQGPPMGMPMSPLAGMGSMPMDPQAPPPGFAGALGQDPSMPQPPQIDPMLIQLLLAQMQADGLEGGMQPEAQAMIPTDPMPPMGLSTQAAGMMGGGGMGMPMPGMGMPGMPQLPAAFAGAQQMAQQRPQSAGAY